MADHDCNAARLQLLLDRMHAGDTVARDELLQGVADRLERLARRMLNNFPKVRQWDDTCDVLQNALLRLLRALNTVKPQTVRDFIGLAAEQIRRELLDMARRYRGGPARERPDGDSDAPRPEPLAPVADPGDLERWCGFHEAVDRLPADEREVVGLVFYHGWTQARIAELFGVDQRTVRRWWRSACQKLHDELGDEAPQL